MKICRTNVDLDVKLFCASNVALKTIHIQPKWQLYDSISCSAWDINVMEDEVTSGL